MSYTDDFLNGLKKRGINVDGLDLSTSGDKYVQDFISGLEKRKKKKAEELVTKSDDIGPVREEEEEEEDKRRWFEKGAFEDGYDFGDITKTILGSLTDARTNFTSGVLGMGESAVDSLLSLAPYMTQAQYYANGGGYNPQADEAFKQANEEGKALMSEWAKKDLYDEKKVASWLVKNTSMGGVIGQAMGVDEEDSVFGDKTDSLVQSGGQLAATAGLAYLGVPWYLTTGVTTHGSEVENALKQGATLDEANLSGLISAGAEILTEKISGGVKLPGIGKTMDDMLPSLIGSNIANKTARTVLKLIGDAGGEGLEEVLSGALSAVGQKLTYADEKELSEIFSTEDAFESFIGGAVLGGGSNVIGAVKSKAEGKDSVTGLTKDEQNVAEKILEKYVQSKDGKVSAKEKAAQWDKITTEMEKGYISADDIEAIIGGESYTNFKAEMDSFFQSDDYKAYRDAVKTEEAARKEFDPLVKMKQGEMTGEQIYRRDELKKILDESKVKELYDKLNVSATKVMESRDKMRSEVFERVKDSKLAESYRELARKSQKFEADVNQYEGKARETVQNIIDSGLGDNSNQFHETVEFLAKISNDKGVTFTFTNTELLKGTEHYKEGYITNGFVDDKGNVVLNNDSENAVRTIVGHEVTHVLKKGMDAESYKALESAVKDYCIAKEGLEKYNARLDAIKEAYKGKDNTSAEEEVTADLVGEYIFTDTEFVKKLSVDSRSTFEKIYDEIKYLFKVAVAGSEEKRKLEKVKKIFDDAWRENVKGKAEATEKPSDAEATIDPENDSDLDYESPVKYSVTVTDPDTIDFLENQEHITTYKAMVLVDGKLYPPMASKVKGEDGKYHMTNPRELGEWMQAEEDTTNIKFNDKGIGYYDLKKDDGGTVRAAYNPYEHSSNLVLNDQFEAAYKRDNLVTVECVIPASEMNSGYKAEYAKDSTGMMDWHSGVVAGKLSDNKRSVYLSRYLKATRILPDAEVAQKYKEIVGDLAVPFNVVSPGLLTELEKVGVNINYDGSPQYQYLQRKAAEREAKKNTKYSLVKDSNGKELTEAQAEFFNASKVRNEAGELTPMYHGTPDGSFTEFQIRSLNTIMSAQGAGYYFTDKANAEQYTKAVNKSVRRGAQKKLYEVYLNITNPMEIRPYERTITEDQFKEVLRKGNNEWFKTDWMPFYLPGNQTENKKLDYETLLDKYTERIFARNNSDGEILAEITRAFNGGDETILNAMAEVFGNDGVHFVDRHGEIWVAWSANQIKNTDNVNPTEDKDIRYSLTKDSDGKELTAEQAEFFKDSEVRDDNGRLKVVYHGTQKGGFTEFVDTDDIGYFFTDKESVAWTYSGSYDEFAPAKVTTWDEAIELAEEHGRELKPEWYVYTISAFGAEHAETDNYDSLEDLLEDYELEEGDKVRKVYTLDGVEYKEDEISYVVNDILSDMSDDLNYKVYLNIKNPMVINGNGSNWSAVIDHTGTMVEYDELTDEQIEAIADNMGMDVDDIYDITDDYGNSLAAFDIDNNVICYPQSTREWVQEAKDTGFDGVIFKDISDPGKFGGGYGAESTVYVVMDSNQIKSTANQNPTADPDIRYSLTKADTDFINAIDQGDMETARKMLDEAAEKAGFHYRGIHRARANFTVFDRERIGSGGGTQFGDGFYVTLATRDEMVERYADSAYGTTKMDLYVKMESPFVVGTPMDEGIVNQMEADFSEFGWFGDDEFARYRTTPEEVKRRLMSDDGYEQMEAIRWIASKNHLKISELLKSYGFDGVIAENSQVKQAVVFDENQLKSANIVNGDDDNNVIPLSQRFNPENNDIRYSLSPEGKGPGYGYVPSRDIGVRDPLAEFAPIREDVAENETTTEEHPINEPWREQFGSITDEDAPPKEITTVQERIQQKIANTQKELDNNRLLREESVKDYNEEIARLQAKYDSKKNKSSMTAQGILRSIERMKRIRDNIDADYSKRISDLEKRVEKYHSQEYSRAEHRRDKMGSYTEMWENLIGDTSTWKDMPLGLQYKTKTLRRILRNVVRGVDGKPDIRLADDIYDELETKYDHNEALLKKESQKLKAVFQELNLNSKEDVYAQMLGELRHNPETTLTEDVVKEYYKKHKNKIDTEKVDKAIDESRKLYDDLLVRVNEVLKEQGFKEIPYRKGYFPHFTNPKQTWWMKALNWKPIDTEIPTSIAGLTETFKPQRSWQSFNQQRRGDQTDYSLYKGLDTYVHGALDWIYHIEDLQKRRALENHLRFIHSDEGIQKRIEEIKKGDYDADEAQDMINAVLDEAKNPLSGLVRELMNRTNTLANKKAAADRAMEDDLNRKVYSTMTNLNNRVSANMVVGSLSSAMTNFIPMVQSWHEVSPGYTVLGLRDVVRSTIKDDGMVAKSDFLTNRLINEENLYKTWWDKRTDEAAIMMNVFDNITAQTVWRSKYLQNLGDGMSESAAIKNADQFAKNLIAGRSRGNMPTLFDAKNPVTKLFTAFQLEVANQYGYMFDDVVKDSTSKTRLVKGYAMAFMGAYVYNALYSTLVGRDAAFDPIAIIEDLMRGLFDDDEENEDVLMDFGEAILQNVPFVGGLLGGGRVPIQSALPYANDSTPFASMLTDVSEGNWNSFGKEFLKPLYYLAMPVGGGQIKKTIEGLGMFSDDHPIAGSYTDSGNLRFPVEETFGNVLQAGLFGQYASQNARDYFDNDFAPLAEKQIDEFADLGIDFRKYHEIREGLRGLSTNAEKVDYINSLDITTEQKNILVNNILDREEKVDMTTYGEYGSYEEFNYAQKNPDKYQFFKDNGISYDDYANADEDGKREYSNMYEWVTDYPGKYEMSKAISDDFLTYWQYKSEMGDLKADKDSNGNTISGSKKEKVIDYINNLDLDYGQKIILFRSMYDSQADRDAYNSDILEYLNSRDDISYEEMVTILTELGFKVSGNTVTWD